MFCTNCGTQFEGNFCPQCGTPAFSNLPGETPLTEIEYPDPPIGEYKASPGTLIIAQDHLVIAGKKINFKSYDLEIPYCAVQNVNFYKAPLGGSLRIAWNPAKVELKDVPATKSYHLFEFTPAKFKDFSVVYEFLNRVAYINSPSEAEKDPLEAYREKIEAQRSPSKSERIKENKKNSIACCPKCGSTSISAHQKGYSVLKGWALGAVFGDMGSHKVIITCLNCGHQWKP